MVQQGSCGQAVGLVAPALQAVLALVFLGFDYSFGLFLLAAAFYGSFVVVAMSAPQWAVGQRCCNSPLIDL